MRTFKPNLTSEMLLSCAESKVNESSRVLDLGCGSGYVGIQLAKSTKLKELCCSDLDKKSFKKVSIEAKKYMVNLHFMQGSLFEPWQGEKFDLIVDDVSGVSEIVARLSPWFKDIPCDTGACGTKLIRKVLGEAKEHLFTKGILIFPIISLSNKEKILKTAKKNFSSVKLFNKKNWFLPESMYSEIKVLETQKQLGNILYEKRFGKIICSTEVYIAKN